MNILVRQSGGERPNPLILIDEATAFAAERGRLFSFKQQATAGLEFCHQLCRQLKGKLCWPGGSRANGLLFSTNGESSFSNLRKQCFTASLDVNRSLFTLAAINLVRCTDLAAAGGEGTKRRTTPFSAFVRLTLRFVSGDPDAICRKHSL